MNTIKLQALVFKKSNKVSRDCGCNECLIKDPELVFEREPNLYLCDNCWDRIAEEDAQDRRELEHSYQTMQGHRGIY